MQRIPNHNDDGSLNPSVNTRLVTGMLVRDPASNPAIYVTSSDPRVGGNGVHTGLDTNSGVVSRLTRTAQGWQRLDLVRGLPRSEHNHATNGIAFDQSANTLYVAQGGHTNRGAPSNFFNQLPEYAYSAAILKIDLNAIGTTTYDLPTLVDDRLPGLTGPFGGDHGRHQAKIVAGSPVQVYASGLRNPYDLVRTSRRLLYTADNGSDKALGATPAGEGPGGACTNAVREYGVEQLDALHLVRAGAYFGHPNPTRGNRANTFNDTVPQSPVPAANPVECDHRAPPENGALTTFAEASTGITEYKAANFGGEMAGDLLVSSFHGVVHRVKLTATGDGVVSSTPLFTGESYLTDVTSRASGRRSPAPSGSPRMSPTRSWCSSPQTWLDRLAHRASRSARQAGRRRPSSSSRRTMPSASVPKRHAMARRSSPRIVSMRPLKSWRCTWIIFR